VMGREKAHGGSNLDVEMVEEGVGLEAGHAVGLRGEGIRSREINVKRRSLE
jgi:hypothetical protein